MEPEIPDLELWLGGIKLEHDRGCVAHSDGDVLLHCVFDAITGALGLPDIGQCFPDNDPKWKGCTSDVFIKEAVRLMRDSGYEMGNIDCTIIAQRPKISPHKKAIKENLAKLLECDEGLVNVRRRRTRRWTRSARTRASRVTPCACSSRREFGLACRVHFNTQYAKRVE